MRYFIFEAGSRAGLSAELFFKEYIKQSKCSDEIVMVDCDPIFSEMRGSNKIIRVDETKAIQMLSRHDIIFPADELTRQCNELIMSFSSNNPFSAIKPWYYDKKYVNEVLSHSKSNIRIPNTFSPTAVIIKPNTKSAGSKGVYRVNAVCVEEAIDIEKEYVVDCFEKNGNIQVFPREIKLKNGYDKYIKLLPTNGGLVEKIKDFVTSANVGSLFKSIFHLQLAENAKGELFYIESSKRISGSSIVNIERGFNPFCFMNGVNAPYSPKHELNKWYRFEDFLL